MEFSKDFGSSLPSVDYQLEVLLHLRRWSSITEFEKNAFQLTWNVGNKRVTWSVMLVASQEYGYNN